MKQYQDVLRIEIAETNQDLTNVLWWWLSLIEGQRQFWTRNPPGSQSIAGAPVFKAQNLRNLDCRQDCAQNKRTCGRLCSTPSDDDRVARFCQLFSDDSNYQYFCPPPLKVTHCMVDLHIIANIHRQLQSPYSSCMIYTKYTIYTMNIIHHHQRSPQDILISIIASYTSLK